MLVSDIQVNMCKKLEETIHVHVRLLSQVFTFDLFNSNFFFQNLSCQTHCAAYLRVQLICECSLSASAAYMPVFTVCQFWSKVITSEAEERPRLVTAGQGRHGSQWVNKKAINPNFAEFLAFLGLFLIDFADLSRKDPAFGKLGHVINPLIPGAFRQKCFFWTFWWFSGWILAKLTLIWSKRHLQHNSLPSLRSASRSECRVHYWDGLGVDAAKHYGTISIRCKLQCLFNYQWYLSVEVPTSTVGEKGSQDNNQF